MTSGRMGHCLCRLILALIVGLAMLRSTLQVNEAILL
jgi:hypothetical protein